MKLLWARLKRDYERHGKSLQNRALWALAVYRAGAWSNQLPEGAVRDLASKFYGVVALTSQIVTGVELHRETKIGEDLHIIHAGNIHIHPEAVLGDRVGIMHDVTIGTNADTPGAPRIGNDVFIGAGAKILGGVTVGDGARIGANSVVLTDVPAGVTVMGVPARPMVYGGQARRPNAPA